MCHVCWAFKVSSRLSYRQLTPTESKLWKKDSKFSAGLYSELSPHLCHAALSRSKKKKKKKAFVEHLLLKD